MRTETSSIPRGTGLLSFIVQSSQHVKTQDNNTHKQMVTLTFHDESSVASTSRNGNICST